jgi:hypothetical protein
MDSYVFPHHRVACRGGSAQHHVYDIDLLRPIGSWKRAWKYASSKASLDYRWHDLRHTFVSRLAENPAVSEEVIRSLVGHVSKQMLQRYSHIRTHAKLAAIAALERDAQTSGAAMAMSQRAIGAADSIAPDNDQKRENVVDGARKWAQPAASRLN